MRFDRVDTVYYLDPKGSLIVKRRMAENVFVHSGFFLPVKKVFEGSFSRSRTDLA